MSAAVSQVAGTTQEYELGDHEFSRIASIVKKEAGIVLGPHKRNLVYGRLAKRLRMRGLRDFTEYLEIVDSADGGNERREMLNAITTNLTAFFREGHHFEMLEKEILPELMKMREKSGGRVRIWSSACSSGEEAYSIAMMVASVLPQAPGCDVKILATDIDTHMIGVAERGVYERKRIDTVPLRLRNRFCIDHDENHVEMSEELKSLIVFRKLNLFDRWPMKGPFDVIFCRNVMIYFDKPSQDALFDRFADYMGDDSWLLIGHSETVPVANTRLVRAGRTAYRRA